MNRWGTQGTRGAASHPVHAWHNAAVKLALPWWDIVVRSVIVYVAFAAVVRVTGKRAIGQFTIFDLVFLLLVSNALQPAITGPDDSVLGGLLIIVTLTTLNFALAFTASRVSFVRLLVEGHPRRLLRDGKWDMAALRRHMVSLDEVDMAMREQGYKDPSELEAAYLENDGRISLIGKEREERHGR